MDIIWRSKHVNIKGKEENIITDYVKGISATTIADVYHTNVSVIYNIIEKNGITKRNKKEARNTEVYNNKRNETIKIKFNSNQIIDIIAEYATGKGVNFISKQYNVDPCVIVRVLKENNITYRDWDAQQEYKHITNKLFKETIISRYGGWQELVSRYRKNFEEKYGEGVVNPMQVEEYFHRQQESALKVKTIVIDDKEFRYQGYEAKAINHLIASGYTVDEIISSKGNVPSFRYMFENKQHMYFPDIYIPKDNKIIEVKSQYIYNLDIQRNIAKQKCVEDAGYKFDFMIL